MEIGGALSRCWGFLHFMLSQERVRSMSERKTVRKTQLFKGYPDVLTVKDLQRALGIGKAAAYTLLENNSIPSFRIGRVYKIPKTALIGYVQNID